MITNSGIAHVNQLGAQMITLANLIYLSEIHNQEIVQERILLRITLFLSGGDLNMSLKKIVCLKNFVGKNTSVKYINGNYYPKDWIAL